jgi:hypothetical protein
MISILKSSPHLGVPRNRRMLLGRIRQGPLSRPNAAYTSNRTLYRGATIEIISDDWAAPYVSLEVSRNCPGAIGSSR